MNLEARCRRVVATGLVLVVGIGLIALILVARRWWMRPRLRVELSLRGSTRAGMLYVRIENVGARPARDVRATILWTGAAGTALLGEQEVDDIEGHGAALLQARDLQHAIRDRGEGWDALVARVVASNAVAAESRLDVRRRDEDPADAPPPVTYSRETTRCPVAPDGVHRMRRDRVLSDGVTETWEVCSLCRHVRLEPLSAADAETQRRVRRERAFREQRRLDEELSRARTDEPRRPPPVREDEAFPTRVAFWVLGLDEASATWVDVQRAHRRLALEHHPDRVQGSTPEDRAAHAAKMQDVNRARDRLREHFRP